MGIQANFDLVFKKSFNIFLIKKIIISVWIPPPPFQSPWKESGEINININKLFSLKWKYLILFEPRLW